MIYKTGRIPKLIVMQNKSLFPKNENADILAAGFELDRGNLIVTEICKCILPRPPGDSESKNEGPEEGTYTYFQECASKNIFNR